MFNRKMFRLPWQVLAKPEPGIFLAQTKPNLSLNLTESGEERRRGNWGSDERVVSGHAEIALFTLETFVEQMQLLAWLILSEYNLHLNCPLS